MIFKEIRIASYADPGEERFYSWWIEGTYDGKTWVRFADSCGSNYETAKAMVDLYNYHSVMPDV